MIPILKNLFSPFRSRRNLSREMSMSRVAQLVVVAAVAAVVLFAVVAKADIDCYECIPTPTKTCADASTFDTVTCKGENAYCRKMIQNVESTVSYVLQCGSAEGGMDKPYYNTANDYVKVYLLVYTSTTVCQLTCTMLGWEIGFSVFFPVFLGFFPVFSNDGKIFKNFLKMFFKNFL